MYKKINIYKKYTANHKIYMIIILICVIIRFIAIFIDLTSVKTAIEDLVIGAIASTLVAWLLDISDCKKKNIDHQEKERMIYTEYRSSMLDLCHFITYRCQKRCINNNSLSLKEWLNILSTKTDNQNELQEAFIKRSYYGISMHIKNIKSALILLHNQYCLLVQTDIVYTGDFLQHISLQLKLCDEICDILETEKYSSKSIKIANSNIANLESNFRTFFLENHSGKYSVLNAKG